jgi:hypothetical protein
LSENSNFAAACEEAGIAFVGPTVANLERFSDKTTARQAAIAAGVPVVPGSDGPIENAEDIVKFVEEIGLPIIIKVCCCYHIVLHCLLYCLLYCVVYLTSRRLLVFISSRTIHFQSVPLIIQFMFHLFLLFDYYNNHL